MTILKSRIGIPVNLPTNASYDLLVLKFPEGFPESILKFDIDTTPRKVTGLQKVAQVFLKVLFTSRGSNVLYPNQGTDFPSLTVNSNINSNDTIFMSELTTQILSAESQTKAFTNRGSNDTSSQLDNVTIIGLDTGQESVVLYLKLVTRAGALAQVAVPFPQLDMKLSDNN